MQSPKKRGVLPPLLLDSDALYRLIICAPMQPPPRHHFPYVLEEDTPISMTFGALFATQIFLGPIGLVFSQTQTFLFNIFNFA